MKQKLILIALCIALGTASASAQKKPAAKPSLKSATFGMGCFWCTEAVFQRLKGVSKVESGYMGGKVKNPTYVQVTSGKTGHAEVAKVSYDPAVISFPELLEVFWKLHDPTTMNRQGADVGTQYRSVIFYYDAQQKAEAEKYKTELNKAKVYPKPIVTKIASAQVFYKADPDHQNYYNLNGKQPYCRMVILPKVEKLENVFKDKLKD